MPSPLRGKKPKSSALDIGDITVFEQGAEVVTNTSESSGAVTQLAWAEVNALALPFAVLNESESRKSQGHEIVKIEKWGDKQVALRWQVWPNPKYGMPTMLTMRVLFVLMQIAADAKNTYGRVPEVLNIGSLNSLCRAVGLPNDGYSRSLIKRHILLLTSTQCMSQGAFKNKEGKGLFIDSFKYLRRAGFVGKDDELGRPIENNYVVFDEPVRQNLDAKYVKQIDLLLMRELHSPIGQLLYTKLSHLFHDAQQRKQNYAEVDYQWLAERMGIKVYAELYRAKAQLKKAIDELIKASYIKSVKWNQWKIRFVPEIRYTLGERLPQQQRKKKAKAVVSTNVQMTIPLSAEDQRQSVLAIQAGWIIAGRDADQDKLRANGWTLADAQIKAEEMKKHQI